jgi:hypothetical protein
MNHGKLKGFLLHFGEFPEKYRLLIWKVLLQLPENRTAFRALSDKEIHPTLKNFRSRYPMKSERLAKSLEKVCLFVLFIKRTRLGHVVSRLLVSGV